MDNCVEQYADFCRSGSFRIFSIQHAYDDLRATLSLVLKDGWWDVSECAGYSNSNVLIEYADYDAEWDMMDVEYDYDIYYLAADIATRYNRTYAQMTKGVQI